MPPPTPSQTIGPFFHYALPWRGGADLAAGGGDAGARLDLVLPEHRSLVSRREPAGRVEGTAIEIAGTVRDGAGAPVDDALLEFWQADGGGHHASAEARFAGFGRAATGPDGTYALRTVKPGPVPGARGLAAPHIAVALFARGLLRHLTTRIYFADEATNADDEVLLAVPAGRRHTLLAGRRAEGRYEFDIMLQGGRETVFFRL